MLTHPYVPSPHSHTYPHTHTLTHIPSHTYPHTHPHHTPTTPSHIPSQAAGAETYGAEGLGVFMEAIWFALKKEVEREREKEMFYICPKCATTLPSTCRYSSLSVMKLRSVPHINLTIEVHQRFYWSIRTQRLSVYHNTSLCLLWLLHSPVLCVMCVYVWYCTGCWPVCPDRSCQSSLLTPPTLTQSEGTAANTS